MTLQERVREILLGIEFRDWWFVVETDRFHVAFRAKDSFTGEDAIQRGRPWLIWPEMTQSAIIFTAWAAIEAAVIHEAREDFKYRGRRVVGPHISVEALWRVARIVDIKREA